MDFHLQLVKQAALAKTGRHFLMMYITFLEQYNHAIKMLLTLSQWCSISRKQDTQFTGQFLNMAKVTNCECGDKENWRRKKLPDSITERLQEGKQRTTEGMCVLFLKAAGTYQTDWKTQHRVSRVMCCYRRSLPLWLLGWLLHWPCSSNRYIGAHKSFKTFLATTTNHFV